MLETRDLTAFYSDFQALFGITFTLNEGETVAIIGANGAGKSTFLKAIAGLLPRPASAVRLDGRDIGALPAYEIVKFGIALVPEGRRLFSSLSVEENLLVGAYGRRTVGPWNLESVYRLFPMLRERRDTPSTALSGGQQQMVAIGRSLMSNPRILLCDELSLGLAPIVIRDIYAALGNIKSHGTSVVLVEQDLVHAMSVADRAYCFQEGRVSLSGRPTELTREAIHAAYFGL
jgi:branched-chain amino acid transport system ATP-binding protein